jgi:nucleoid DNA-binding protein
MTTSDSQELFPIQEVQSVSLSDDMDQERSQRFSSEGNLPNLTKRDLVMKIAKETNLIQEQVFSVIQKTLDHITDALAKGQSIELRNFGTFEVRLTRPKPGRNPNRPEIQVTIPSRAVVKFTAGKVMRERVRDLTEQLKKSSSESSPAVSESPAF